jgi:hypothetical protein
MRRDLAPKFLYYYHLIGFTLGLVFVGIIIGVLGPHRVGTALYVLATIWLVLLLFVMNKCWYMTVDRADNNKLVIGNIATTARVISINEFVISNSFARRLFKINLEGTNYYFFSERDIVEEYQRN